MTHAVAIIAPMFDPFAQRYNMDFTLRFKKNNEELTLENLYHLLESSYDLASIIKREYIKQDTISAAGYYLSAALRKSGYNTIVTESTDVASLCRIAAVDPLAICISSTMILNRQSLAQLINQIRAVFKDTTIIVGGILVWKSFKWLELLKQQPQLNSIASNVETAQSMLFPCNRSEMNADVFIVSQHGIRILFQILEELKRGSHKFEAVNNIAIPDNHGNFIFNTRIDEAVDYNQDYTYWDMLDTLPHRIPVRTSIGCPYRCGYCDFCYLFPNIFLRSEESIRAELGMIKKALSSDRINKRMLNLTDDNVFINKKRVNSICNTLLESDIKLPWGGFIRASSVTEENIEKIKESLLIRAWIGVESGDQEQLERMKKKQKLGDLKKGIEILDSNGISVNMFFIVGYPGETYETLTNTAEFLNGLRISLSVYTIYPLVVAPMSELSLPALREKWGITGIFTEWSHNTMNSRQARDKCFMLFSKVEQVPYYYNQENFFFNQRFNYDTRRKLYKLRNDLTAQLIKKAGSDAVAPIFSEMAAIIKLNSGRPPKELIDEINYPVSV